MSLCGELTSPMCTGLGAVGREMRGYVPVCVYVHTCAHALHGHVGEEGSTCTSWISLSGGGDGHQCSLDGFLFPNKQSYDTMSESPEDFLSPLAQCPACCKPRAGEAISSPPLPSTLSSLAPGPRECHELTAPGLLGTSYMKRLDILLPKKTRWLGQQPGLPQQAGSATLPTSSLHPSQRSATSIRVHLRDPK